MRGKAARSDMSAAAGPNLTTRIVNDLGIAIVTGQYSDAHPFPVESDLCKQFEASRSVVREAVKMLTAKGLLKARPRQGTRVQPEEMWNLLDPDVLRWMLERKFSLQLLVHFTEVRLGVEPFAASLAARTATPAHRAGIELAIERMIAADDGDGDPLEADIAFHTAVLNASGNPFYIQMRDFIATALRFSIRRTNTYKGVGSVLDHKRVADAILAGDGKEAERAMRFLIEDAMKILVEGARHKAKRA